MAADLQRLPLSDVLRSAIARFKAAGLDSPGLDARLLIGEATGWSGDVFIRDPGREVGYDALDRIEGFVLRRLAHEPVSRILGRRAFWGRDFEVTPATLDPRPDSEVLIAAVLERAARCAVDGVDWPRRILDIGTGTGCLLLTLLAERPAAVGAGLDLSSEALVVARRNAERLALTSRASWLPGDALAPDWATVVPDLGSYDLIVSNPPYIPTVEIAGLEPDVRLFDPVSALDGGADGLAFYRALVRTGSNFGADAWVFAEIGAGQAADVAALVRSAAPAPGQAEVLRYPDLGGHVRCVAWKPRS